MHKLQYDALVELFREREVIEQEMTGQSTYIAAVIEMLTQPVPETADERIERTEVIEQFAGHSAARMAAMYLATGDQDYLSRMGVTAAIAFSMATARKVAMSLAAIEN